MLHLFPKEFMTIIISVRNIYAINCLLLNAKKTSGETDESANRFKRKRLELVNISVEMGVCLFMTTNMCYCFGHCHLLFIARITSAHLMLVVYVLTINFINVISSGH